MNNQSANRRLKQFGPAAPALNHPPDIRLHGEVGEAMVDSFLQQLTAIQDRDGPVLLELCTLGGDAEAGERIAEDIRLHQEQFGLDMYFLGKTAVYSAGISILSAFPVERRFLTSNTTLLIHERRLNKPLELNGPLRACEVYLHDALAEVQSGKRIQKEGFERLIHGTALSFDELMHHVMSADWYLTVDDALRYKLVSGAM